MLNATAVPRYTSQVYHSMQHHKLACMHHNSILLAWAASQAFRTCDVSQQRCLLVCRCPTSSRCTIWLPTQGSECLSTCSMGTPIWLPGPRPSAQVYPMQPTSPGLVYNMVEAFLTRNRGHPYLITLQMPRICSRIPMLWQLLQQLLQMLLSTSVRPGCLLTSSISCCVAGRFCQTRRHLGHPMDFCLRPMISICQVGLRTPCRSSQFVFESVTRHCTVTNLLVTLVRTRLI